MTLLGLTALAVMSVAEPGWWTVSKNRLTMANKFNSMATMCAADFGFTRIPAKPPAEMADKIEAHLLLAPNADRIMQDWTVIVVQGTYADADVEAAGGRLADAALAAKKDPSTYARAEKVAVDAMMSPVNKVLAACQAATRNDFFAAHYVTGTGSSDRFVAVAKKHFAEQATAK